ncbi:CBP3-like protein [Naviculisporaceae sp. PSN 640]
MACRGCSKSGLGLLSRRSATTCSLEARISFSHPANTRLVSSSSARPTTVVSSSKQQQPRNQRQPGTINASRSLHTPPTKETGSEPKEGSPVVGNLAKILKAAVGGKTNTYAIYGLTQNWAKLCAGQADYTISKEDRKAEKVKTTEEGEEVGTSKGGVWHDEFHLLPTFSTWSQVGMLHMYLLAVRFRALDKESHEKWQKQLVDHFFHEAEAKMDLVHDMTSSSLRQRYLKDLFVQWRGVILAYDEGLVKGDAVLASAVWRNLFKAREDVDLRVLAAVVAWMRRCLRALDRTDDADLPFVVGELFAARKPSLMLPAVDEWSGLVEGFGGQNATTEGGVTGSEETPGKKTTSRFT